ncbi:MAG TPA: hypothetical protein VGO67_16250 [Verrucomicrobiae bacterium]|jgi:hypothetical protein
MTGSFMKFVTAAVVIIGLALGVWQINNYWGTFNKHKHHSSDEDAVQIVADDQLPGMPESLDPALGTARQRGVAGLKEFLTAYGNTISDPRRASIELDYAELLAVRSSTDARRYFMKVKGRIDSSSPVYARLKQLEKTYPD